jgi:hypothetical protein
VRFCWKVTLKLPLRPDKLAGGGSGNVI